MALAGGDALPGAVMFTAGEAVQRAEMLVRAEGMVCNWRWPAVELFDAVILFYTQALQQVRSWS